MPLTLATMTTREPSDADVADTAAEPAALAEATATATTGADASAEDSVLSRPYRALSIGIVSVVLLIAFEATAVGTAMPVAARELDGVSLYAFAFSAYFTTSLFGMVLAGQWSDRHGPLAALTAGIGAFAAGLALSGTAGVMWLFILGRAVQGFGGGLVIVALYVVVGRAYPEHLRPSIMAAFAASWVIPSIVGPLASRLGDRTARLALGVHRHTGPGGVPTGARPAADTAVGVRPDGGRRRCPLRPAPDPAGAGDLAGRGSAAVRGASGVR